MGILRISKDLIGTEYFRVALKFIKKEHRAKVTQIGSNTEFVEYRVDGDEIPKDSKNLVIELNEIVPKVFIIRIKLLNEAD